MSQPLVSILIPNYNYARYLPECLDSVLNQTYNNIECIISDNASTDNSWEIIENYKEKFEKRGYIFKTFRNENNIGSYANIKLCEEKLSGEYTHYLCSDDSIEPTFIEKGIKAFNLSENIGLVIFNRNEMNQFSEKTESIPFYNTNCIIPGEAQAAVYMMSGIAVLSQSIYKTKIREKTKYLDKKFNYIGDWHYNFRMCMICDVVYIKEPLFNYRYHQENETIKVTNNLLAVFEEFIMINDFLEIAKHYNKEAPIQRFEKAINKIGHISLRNALITLKDGNIKTAQQYLLLALVFDQNLVNTEEYQILNDAINTNNYSNLCKLEKFSRRQVSYDPPKGYIEISI